MSQANLLAQSLSSSVLSNSTYRADRHLVLRVCVVRTRNLRIHISPVLPALSIMISVEMQEAKSKEIRLKTLLDDPEWNFDANFDISHGDVPILFTLFNHDEILPIGQGLLPINQVPFDSEPVEKWVSLKSPRDTESGEVLVQVSIEQSQTHVGIQSFDLLCVIGIGGFGKVIQVQKKDTKRIYAMKILKKAYLIEREEVDHVMSEQAVLKKIRHSFIVSLKYSFQSEDKLYMLMDFINGGELFRHLRLERSFPEHRARFYAAEIILALEYLHKMDLIYRDLKPENILLDMQGHICVTDFGLVKSGMGHGKLTYTFCGTAEYLAPEIIEEKGYTKSVDWWSVGILIYEMLVGQTPFLSSNHQQMYQRIVEGKLGFPAHLSDDAKSLISGLLQVDSNDRFGGGASDAEEIKSHPFFLSIDWIRLSQRRVIPPFRPRVTSKRDYSNFDPEFTREPAVDSPTHSQLNKDDQSLFRGFSFTGSNFLDEAEESHQQ